MFYTLYNDGLTLVNNATYGFNVPSEGLKFNFPIINETNPAYYIIFNKLGSGDLTIKINDSENIIIKDSYPYRSLYINRKNLFKDCANQEPYICSINIEVSGNNIPFTLLINDAHEDYNYFKPIYFNPNEMVVGISESFNPLYFFTDIKSDSEGEVIINYKKGGNIVYSEIVDKSKDDITKWKGIQNNIYDIYNKKITFNKQNTSSEICTKGCRLYIGIYVYDYEVDDANDFSLFLRYTDDIND